MHHADTTQGAPLAEQMARAFPTGLVERDGEVVGAWWVVGSGGRREVEGEYFSVDAVFHLPGGWPAAIAINRALHPHMAGIIVHDVMSWPATEHSARTGAPSREVVDFCPHLQNLHDMVNQAPAIEHYANLSTTARSLAEASAERRMRQEGLSDLQVDRAMRKGDWMQGLNVAGGVAEYRKRAAASLAPGLASFDREAVEFLCRHRGHALTTAEWAAMDRTCGLDAPLGKAILAHPGAAQGLISEWRREPMAFVGEGEAFVAGLPLRLPAAFAPSSSVARPFVGTY